MINSRVRFGSEAAVLALSLTCPLSAISRPVTARHYGSSGQCPSFEQASFELSFQ